MTTQIPALTRNHELLTQLQRQFAGRRPIAACETLDGLKEVLHAGNADAVLVHMDQSTLDDRSPSQFLVELGEAANETPIVALIDRDCPPRLKRLAQKVADESLEFPLDLVRLERLVAGRQETSFGPQDYSAEMPHKGLHGQSRSLVTFTPEMFEMLGEIEVAARHNVTVLLTGETGCGKTFLARLIHELSDRREERLCTLACGALPPDLIESELFGHVKGAFTGADRNRAGKFAAAGRGTLLLDEIDVLSIEQQARLLRVIETGEYEPVGSNETQHSQARLIVASNYNLEQLVRAGGFRTDLYYRLNVLSFRLLPLRERPQDIDYLVHKFAQEECRTHRIPLKSIEPGFTDALRAYPWPGNVRELENVIRRAVLYCRHGVLTVADLPRTIWAASGSQEFGRGIPEVDETQHVERLPTAAGGRAEPSIPASLRRVAAFRSPQRPASTLGQPSGPPGVAAAGGSRTAVSLEARVDVHERRIIEDCLQRNNFRRKDTAAELGISRVTLYNKMKKFGLM